MTADRSDAPFGDGVPLVVPAGWKRASLGAPVPVIRCTYIFPDTHDRPGEQCKKWSLRGATKCIKHGAQLENVRQHAEAVVESARLRLIGSTDDAVDWLLELAEKSTSDAVRLKATTEVLDRAGVRGGVEVDVNVSETQNPGDVLRERLEQLKRRTIEGQLADEASASAALEAATSADTDDTVNPCTEEPRDEENT